MNEYIKNTFLMIKPIIYNLQNNELYGNENIDIAYGRYEKHTSFNKMFKQIKRIWRKK